MIFRGYISNFKEVKKVYKTLNKKYFNEFHRKLNNVIL